MADRVHPADSSPATPKPTTVSPENTPESSSKPDHHPPPATTVTPPGTTSPPATTVTPPGTTSPPAGQYVIKIPKDQIFRYPPPENARRFQEHTRKKNRRSFGRRCCCWTLAVVAILTVLVGAAAGILYLVFRPEAPKYTVNDVVARGFNLTMSAPISPEFDVIIRAHNPNDELGIYYGKASSVTVRYGDVDLSNGVLPKFFQPSNNVTVFQTALRGSDILLTNTVKSELQDAQRRGMVPLRLNVKAPVKFKVGAVKTWTFTVKFECDVTVNNLTAESIIVSTDCDYSVKPW